MVNKYRLVETWVDEPYKQIIIDYSHKKLSEVNIGDISERVKVRKDMQCKPFQYFLDKVREFSNFHIPTDSLKIASLRNVQSNMCLERYINHDYPAVFPCQGRGSTQLFELTERSELRHLGQCIYVAMGSKVLFKHCDHFLNKTDKEWDYSETDYTLKHISSGKCLEAGTRSTNVSANACSSSEFQKWIWEPVKVK